MGKIQKNVIVNLFKKYDKNNNGVIERNELAEVFKEIIGSVEDISPEEHEAILNEGTKTKQIVGRNKEYLMTLENELIPLKDIIDIYPK